MPEDFSTLPPAGNQEADAPEHAPFRRGGQPAEDDSQPLSQGLVECHPGLCYDRRRLRVPASAAAGAASSRPSTTVTAIQSVS